jgi:exopolysaccharide biosynthesis polyprenyl glycosylphosphotransferase
MAADRLRTLPTVLSTRFLRHGAKHVARRNRSILNAAVDLAILIGVMMVVTAVLWGSSHILTSRSVRLGVAVSIIVVGRMAVSGLYNRGQARRWTEAMRVVLTAVVFGAAVFSLAGFFVAIGGGARRWLVLVAFSWLALLSIRHAVWAAIRAATTQRRVIIAGSAMDAVAMRTALRSDTRHAYDVIGFVLDQDQPLPPKIVSEMALGSIVDLPVLTEIHRPDQVVFCMGGLPGDKFAPLARTLSQNGISVALTGLGDVAASRVAVSQIQGQPMVHIAPSVRSGWQVWTKRAVDLVGASILFLMLSPFLAAVALTLWLVDRESPIFRQDRVGKGGRHFEILKFRTMVAGAEELQIDLTNELEGPLFKMVSDPRVTRIGAFLRRTSIDELPQLWNVIRGDMSLVGPRPFIPSEVAAAPPDFRQRELVMPGMTGHWQVSGRSDTSFDELDDLDRWYVDNWSLGQDLGILAKTVPAVFLSRGAR